jgi:hypothetical protein
LWEYCVIINNFFLKPNGETMKKIYLLFILSLVFTTISMGQTVIAVEDFDNDTQYTVTLGGEGNDGNKDYFQRTNGTNINISYSGFNGSYFFAGQDIDDGGWTGSASPSELTWSNINISGYTDIQIKGLFASKATDKIDDADFIHFQYRIDGGTWTNLIWFENDGTAYNTYFLEDTNFDGVGESTQLTSTFTEFTKSIPATGSTLDFRLTVAVDAGDEDFAVDYLRVLGTSSSGVANPTSFSASAGGTSSTIDLSWNKNSNGDNVMVAYNTSNVFGDPADGETYAVGELLPGGNGKVIYNAGGASCTHDGLTANTTYYYKAWSVDGSVTYSSGVETNAKTVKDEPLKYPADFKAATNGPGRIDLTWTDATDSTAPDGYLIKANLTGTFTDPVDGTDENDATDSNGGTVNVSQGVGSYNWTGLDANTTYYFKIWSYTNSGSHINYKTDGTPPTANETTEATSIPDLIITEIMQNPSAVDDNKGEWFEIYNNTGSSVDLNGYIIKDDGTDIDTISSSVVVASKDFVVLGENSDASTNGGVTINYEYSKFTLGNGADEVIIIYSDGTTEIDRVEYDGGPNFPDPNGASMVLTDLSKDNNTGSNWTTSTTREGDYDGSATDKGSPGVLGSDAVLPVELTSFTASAVAGGVMLNWATATEVDNYGFEVERSYSENVWETIGFVEGHGNSNTPQEYSYFDNSVAGNVSYRLKQLDNNGACEYSGIVSVNAGFAKTELFQNHPNPFNPTTQISFVLAKAGEVNVSVYNTLGQKVAELINGKMSAGNHSVKFDANDFASGFYFYTLRTNDYNKTMKMILIK